jgi:hypothetical protein
LAARFLLAALSSDFISENNKKMKINSLKGISIAAIILLLTSFVMAQKASKTGYKVRAGGLKLVVTYQGKPHILNTTEQIDAAKITDTEILFANRKDNFTYLVIAVGGPSKAKSDDRQCGAGEEDNLLWIKLDSKWKIEDIKSVRYESCWAPTTSDEGYKIKNNTLTIHITDFHRDVDALVSYSANEPEKGFKITELAIEKR